MHTGTRDWQQWILVESTRRTWVVASYVLSIFRMMKDGQSDCNGKIPLTMRLGLWDAMTGLEWNGIMKRYDALFVEPETADVFYQVVSPSDVDSFAGALVSVI